MTPWPPHHASLGEWGGLVLWRCEQLGLPAARAAPVAEVVSALHDPVALQRALGLAPELVEPFLALHGPPQTWGPQLAWTGPGAVADHVTRPEHALAIGRACAVHSALSGAFLDEPAPDEAWSLGWLDLLPDHPGLDRGRVALATAGQIRGGPRTLQARFALVDAGVLDAAGAVLQPLSDCDASAALAQALHKHLRSLSQHVRLRALFAGRSGQDPWADPSQAGAVLADARAKAIRWLLAEPTFRRSWEDQQWGLAEDPQPLVGKDYILGTIWRALHAAGVPQARPALRDWLRGLGTAPLRYYGPWDRIPPDCDSLGLALQVAALLQAPRERAHGWLSVLRPSLGPNGAIPVWLERGPGGQPTCPEPQWAWGGDQCAASRTMAVLGLVGWDPMGWRDVLDPNLDQLLAAGPDASFYYEPWWADLFTSRLCQALARALPDHPTLPGFQQRVRQAVAQALSTQAADGGWGSPQRTAARLCLLGENGHQGLDLQRGARYLVERQGPDGAWPPEPYFVTLGRPPLPTHLHGGPGLTTALCLQGLAAASPASPRAP